MRNYVKRAVSFMAICILFTSCSKLIYKHQNFMDGLKNREDVLKHFGNPNEYRNQGETSEWLYDLGTQKKINTRDADPISKITNTGKGKEVEQFSNFKKYVQITFKNDSVTSWKSEGVDYTLRKTKPGASILLGAGIGLALLVLIIAGSDLAYFPTF